MVLFVIWEMRQEVYKSLSLPIFFTMIWNMLLRMDFPIQPIMCSFLIVSFIHLFILSITYIIHRKEVTGDYCLVGPGALVEMCSLVESAVIGPFAHIVSSHIVNSSIMSSQKNPTL